MPTTEQMFAQAFEELKKLEAKIDDLAATPQPVELVPAPIDQAIIEAAARERARVAAEDEERNGLVRFTVSTFFVFDGLPEPGNEVFAPKDFDVKAHKEANGIDPDNLYPGQLINEFDEPVTISGDSFDCPRDTAKALARAKIGTWVEIE